MRGWAFDDDFVHFRIPVWCVPRGGTAFKIPVAHCDPAGIGFYPRYVELVNEVVEDWCRDGLSVGFHQLHEQLRFGLPVARLEMEFMIPSRYGDVLDFSLRILRIGASSMSIEVCATAEARLRFRGELVVAMMSLDSLRPVVIDAGWRARFERYLVTAESA